MSEKKTKPKTVEIDFDICKAIDERDKTMLTFCKALHALAATAELIADKPKQDDHEHS